MARKHDNKMTNKGNITVNQGYMEKVTKNAKYQQNEKKARMSMESEKQMMHDHSVRKKE